MPDETKAATMTEGESFEAFSDEEYPYCFRGPETLIMSKDAHDAMRAIVVRLNAQHSALAAERARREACEALLRRASHMLDWLVGRSDTKPSGEMVRILREEIAVRLGGLGEGE